MFKNRLVNNLIEEIAMWAIKTIIMFVLGRVYFEILWFISEKIEDRQKARKSKKDK